MVCDRCRKSVPVSDVKYIPKPTGGFTQLCSICRDRNKTSKPETLEIIRPKKQVIKEKIREAKHTHADMSRTNYFCTRCNYQFKYGLDGVTVLRCPYCGKSDKVSEWNGGAESLVRDL